MTALVVVTADGVETKVDAEPGHSLMEVVRGAGFDEILALCGGCCSCASCHVYIDNAFLGALPPMSDDEDALLDGSDHRRESSRLSCQVAFTVEFAGMRVTIAPEE